MTPIDMVLHCPACGMQHIDAPGDLRNDYAVVVGLAEVSKEYTPWTNPPHRSHKCAGCGHVWRPADVETNGVAAIKTKGNADSPIHDCRAGHSHEWRNVEGMFAPIRSECRHCGVVLPF